MHVDYLEAKLPNITPTKLLKLADDKAKVLKHAGQWKDIDTPTVMALKITLEKQKSDSDNLVWQLVAHVSKLTNQRSYPHQHYPHNPNHPDSNKRHYDCQILAISYIGVNCSIAPQRNQSCGKTPIFMVYKMSAKPRLVGKSS